MNGPYNFTGHGNTGNWPNVIRKAKALHFQHVLPGHGGAGGREIVDGQLRFFEELNKAVETAFKQKKKMSDSSPSRTITARPLRCSCPMR